MLTKIQLSFSVGLLSSDQRLAHRLLCIMGESIPQKGANIPVTRFDLVHCEVIR